MGDATASSLPFSTGSNLFETDHNFLCIPKVGTPPIAARLVDIARLPVVSENPIMKKLVGHAANN